MKSPSAYTLGEIRMLLTVTPNSEALQCVDKLTLLVEAWEKQAQAYQVQREIEQIKHPQEISRRKCASLDDAALDALVIIEA